MVSKNLTTRDSVDITTVYVLTPGVPHPFKVRHLQRDAFGHGGVLHGSRSYGPRVGIGNTNGLSPNLHTHKDGPHATERSGGWVCVETMRIGSLF
jgi:hypothetical protein